MPTFIQAQAKDADWLVAINQCWSQIGQQLANSSATKPTVGWCYLTDHYARDAGAIIAGLHQLMPGMHWIGTIAVGIGAGATEYFDEPAMVLLIADLPPESFQLFSGSEPLATPKAGFEPFTALVHAEGSAPDFPAKLQELSSRTATGYLFGGLSSARNQALHFADEIFIGGMSGIAFSSEIPLLSRVTQGCQPVGPTRSITRSEGNYLVTLDGQRALDCVMEDLGLPADIADEELRQILTTTLTGLTAQNEDLDVQPGRFGTNTEVRHLVGVSRKSGVLVVAENIKVGMRLAFCKRNADAAKHDLLRIIEEIRAQCGTSQRIAGALYISCSGRGGPHFGTPNAEFELVSNALGGVPLAGFFAGGEIARHHLYGYTGVLTAFIEPI